MFLAGSGGGVSSGAQTMCDFCLGEGKGLILFLGFLLLKEVPTYFKNKNKTAKNASSFPIVKKAWF